MVHPTRVPLTTLLGLHSPSSLSNSRRTPSKESFSWWTSTGSSTSRDRLPESTEERALSAALSGLLQTWMVTPASTGCSNGFRRSTCRTPDTSDERRARFAWSQDVLRWRRGHRETAIVWSLALGVWPCGGRSGDWSWQVAVLASCAGVASLAVSQMHRPQEGFHA